MGKQLFFLSWREKCTHMHGTCHKLSWKKLPPRHHDKHFMILSILVSLFWILHPTSTYLGALSKRDCMFSQHFSSLFKVLDTTKIRNYFNESKIVKIE